MSVFENEFNIIEMTVHSLIEFFLCVAYVNGVTQRTFLYIDYIYITEYTFEYILAVKFGFI